MLSPKLKQEKFQHASHMWSWAAMEWGKKDQKKICLLVNFHTMCLKHPHHPNMPSGQTKCRQTIMATQHFQKNRLLFRSACFAFFITGSVVCQCWTARSSISRGGPGPWVYTGLLPPVTPAVGWGEEVNTTGSSSGGAPVTVLVIRRTREERASWRPASAMWRRPLGSMVRRAERRAPFWNPRFHQVVQFNTPWLCFLCAWAEWFFFFTFNIAISI